VIVGAGLRVGLCRVRGVEGLDTVAIERGGRAARPAVVRIENYLASRQVSSADETGGPAAEGGPQARRGDPRDPHNGSGLTSRSDSPPRRWRVRGLGQSSWPAGVAWRPAVVEGFGSARRQGNLYGSPSTERRPQHPRPRDSHHVRQLSGTGGHPSSPTRPRH